MHGLAEQIFGWRGLEGVALHGLGDGAVAFHGGLAPKAPTPKAMGARAPTPTA